MSHTRSLMYLSISGCHPSPYHKQAEVCWKLIMHTRKHARYETSYDLPSFKKGWAFVKRRATTGGGGGVMPRLYALDCEMVETDIDNNSLVGLCLVDETGKAVYKVRWGACRMSSIQYLVFTHMSQHADSLRTILYPESQDTAVSQYYLPLLWPTLCPLPSHLPLQPDPPPAQGYRHCIPILPTPFTLPFPSDTRPAQGCDIRLQDAFHGTD